MRLIFGMILLFIVDLLTPFIPLGSLLLVFAVLHEPTARRLVNYIAAVHNRQ